MKTDKKLLDRAGEHIAFGLTDEKGRAIGTFIQRETVEYVERIGPVEGYCYYEREPGVSYEFRPHVTRNGQCYGAMHGARIFKTVDEREAAIAEYIAGAKKRAAKHAK